MLADLNRKECIVGLVLASAISLLGLFVAALAQDAVFNSHGWIIVDAQLWENNTRRGLDELLDTVKEDYDVEGIRLLPR